MNFLICCFNNVEGNKDHEEIIKEGLDKNFCAIIFYSCHQKGAGDCSHIFTKKQEVVDFFQKHAIETKKVKINHNDLIFLTTHGDAANDILSIKDGGIRFYPEKQNL